MLKKIAIDQVTLGMHVHAVCGSWFDNPFWSNSFSLQTPLDLARLQGARIRQVWIDTTRGADVTLQQGGQAAMDDGGVGDAGARPSSCAPAPEPQQRRCTEQTGTAEELTRAARIIEHSKRELACMFADIRMGRMVDMARTTPLVEEISASVTRNAGALVSLVRLKQADDYTYLHSVAVCAMMVALARQLGLEEEEVHQCGMAGLLHDVGKMTVPAPLLNKPGKLTDAEFAYIKTHPVNGHRLLSESGNVPALALDVCLHHHERIDGAGYPHGLRGEQLSLHARMGAICDIYDAITSTRPYKAAWSPGIALRRMAEWTRSGHLDAQVFAAFVKCMGIYPMGTLVRLRSDRLAVVTDNSHSLLAPVVRVFFSIRHNVHMTPVTIDLAHARPEDGIACHEDPDTWDLGDLTHFWTPA